MVYIITILFTLCFVLYSKFQFEERAGRSFGKWHPFGWMMRTQLFACFFIQPRIADVILSAGISIILFELLINKVALKKTWLFVGSTSWLDKKLGINKWWIYLVLLAATIFFKFFSKFIS